MPIEFDPREVRAATLEELTLLQHEIASKVLGVLVLSTPVGMPSSWKSSPPKGYQPGHARASWQTLLARDPTRDLPLGVVDPGGASTIAKGIRIIRRSKFGVNIIIGSLAPYMDALNKGHSRQAGANFVEKAAAIGAASVSNDTKTMPASKKVKPRRGSGTFPKRTKGNR